MLESRMKLVVVGIISRVIEKEIKYLLMSSTKDWGKFTGFYYPPGGHAEKGEDEKTALIREIKEEINLDIRLVSKIAETAGDVPGQTTSWWRCEIKDDVNLNYKQENEVADVRWFSEEEIRNEVKIWPATRKVFLEFVFQERNL